MQQRMEGSVIIVPPQNCYTHEKGGTVEVAHGTYYYADGVKVRTEDSKRVYGGPLK